MSNYTAFHLKSTDIDGIQATCEAWLAAVHPTQTISVKIGRFPSPAFAKPLYEKPEWVILKARRGLFGFLR